MTSGRESHTTGRESHTTGRESHTTGRESHGGRARGSLRTVARSRSVWVSSHLGGHLCRGG